MKYFILLVFNILIMNISLAAIHPKDLSLKVQFDYQYQTTDGASKKLLFKNDIKTSMNNHQWTIVEDKLHPTDSIILLIKIEKADPSQIAISFLVINSGKTPKIVAAPRIIAAYGQKNKLRINNKNQEIEIEILAISNEIFMKEINVMQ